MDLSWDNFYFNIWDDTQGEPTYEDYTEWRAGIGDRCRKEDQLR
jgi:hypothetical protein